MTAGSVHATKLAPPRECVQPSLQGAPEINGVEALCGPLLADRGRYELHLLDQCGGAVQ
jgi:hypothetical protein